MGANLIRMVRAGKSFSGHEKNCAFLNSRDQQFANVSAVTGLDFDDDSRSAARVDWDLDGDVDFWFSNRNGPAVRFLQNNLSQENGFLALRLRGVDCNRDAIGARVEVRLKGDPRPLVRSLVAGDGYLTQSSKWLHFGLGRNAEIESVRVRWPGGEFEAFDGIQPSGFFEIVEHAGKATRSPLLQSRLATSKNEGQALALPATKTEAAIYAATRLPVPRLAFETRDREPVPLEVNGPTLLILWASWCQPCVEELSELAEHAAELSKRSVRVLALSVDRLDAKTGNETRCEEILTRMNFPFENGFASEGTVHKLELTHHHLFGLQRPLPVPSAFLIDSDNRLASVYRGTVKVDRLLRDLDQLDFDHEQRRNASVPFAGRWVGKPRTLRLAPLVVELAKAGFVEDASEYVQRMQNRFDRNTILDLVVRLGVEYYRNEQQDYSDLHFRMARKIDPKTILPELRLATYFENERHYENAAAVLHSKPHPALQTRLAWLLSACPVDAVRNTQAAAQIANAQLAQGLKTPRLLDTVAVLHAERGEFERAVEVAKQAILLAKKQNRHRLAEEIGQRVRGYEAKKTYRDD